MKKTFAFLVLVSLLFLNSAAAMACGDHAASDQPDSPSQETAAKQPPSGS